MMTQRSDKQDVLVLPPDEVSREVRARFEELCNESIRASGRFSCALTGGSTVEYYRALVDAKVDWSKVHVFWGDERAVAADHPDSNFRAAHDAWLSHVALVPEHVHRIHAEAPDLDGAALAYEDELVRTLGATPSIDLVHVGVGPDGHVCSLFPGHPALEESV